MVTVFVNWSGRNEHLHRGHSIDASYQVSVHLVKRFQRKRFFKSANQKQELPVVAMFVNGSRQNVQSLERTFDRCFLPSFSSFGWGVSEEKIKMWKVNGQRMPSDGKSSHYLWQGGLKKVTKNKIATEAGEKSTKKCHPTDEPSQFWRLVRSVY